MNSPKPKCQLFTIIAPLSTRRSDSRDYHAPRRLSFCARRMEKNTIRLVFENSSAAQIALIHIIVLGMCATTATVARMGASRVPNSRSSLKLRFARVTSPLAFLLREPCKCRWIARCFCFFCSFWRRMRRGSRGVGPDCLSPVLSSLLSCLSSRLPSLR